MERNESMGDTMRFAQPVRSLLLLAAVALAGCGPSAQLKAASSAILAASEACLFDVRDKNIKYEASKNCNSLRVLSDKYIDAGGLRTDTSTEIQLEYAYARMHAWMALALSVSNGNASRVW
jgi:hypothetical protein